MTIAVNVDILICQDYRTLAEIYSGLPSPVPLPAPGWQELSRRLLDFDDNLDGLGMRSKLFKYQRRSVATLLQKEMNLSAIPDPLYIQKADLHGNTFYLQPGRMEILRERPMVSPARGGILCEELGKYFPYLSYSYRNARIFRHRKNGYDFDARRRYYSRDFFSTRISA